MEYKLEYQWVRVICARAKPEIKTIEQWKEYNSLGGCKVYGQSDFLCPARDVETIVKKLQEMGYIAGELESSLCIFQDEKEIDSSMHRLCEY